MFKNTSERVSETQREIIEKYHDLIEQGVKPHRAEEMSRDGRWND